MFDLSNLKPQVKRPSRKRVGRGLGSGLGTFAGRGNKGQKARSGGNIRPGFEGGRMPLVRQLPKVRGFKSIHAKSEVVSLADLQRHFKVGGKINPEVLHTAGLIDNKRGYVKILGKTKISAKFQVEGIELSDSAKVAIEAAGGNIVLKPSKQ